jgi:hypothetical protein
VHVNEEQQKREYLAITHAAFAAPAVTIILAQYLKDVVTNVNVLLRAPLIAAIRTSVHAA